jgi:geranylgeranyl pyrophosphate synthase
MVQKNIIHDVATGKTTVVDYTPEQQADYDDYNSTEKITARKLEQIREIRNQKLSETDYLAMSDNVISEEMKTYRKNLRNIPQDYSEANYDNLLARDEQGNLTHTVWSKP